MAKRWWVVLGLFLAAWGVAIWWYAQRDRDNPWDAVARNSDSRNSSNSSANGGKDAPGESSPVSYFSLVQDQTKLDETVWSKEVMAQKYETTFVALWDMLRAARDQFSVLGTFPFERLTLGKPGKRDILDWDIRGARCDAEPFTLSAEEFRSFLAARADEGWRLVQSEWHHAQFDPPADGKPARSIVNAVLHVANDKKKQLAIIKGGLRVTWAADSDALGQHVVQAIDATHLEILTRVGDVAFASMARLGPTPGQLGPSWAEPIVLGDVDRDGLSDILVVGRNALMQNRGGGKFELRPIANQLPRAINTALLADLTGDGEDDLTMFGGPTLYVLRGHDRGHFDKPPLDAWTGPCQFPTVITAGDIDADGDLDLFVGQYKNPYDGGQMPTPYYDANDGLPAFLLINDGHGKFTEATEAAGLGKKRFRRTYGASFIDLDGDHALDLLVTSDFAGVDIYRNDGHGKFTDVTDKLVDDRHNFGMAHTFGDFDLDGKLDFYSIGMSSTTARRLDYLKLTREDRADIHRMRGRMGYGNRMFLGRGDRFVQPDWKDQVARTGWSWGATSFDFDLDGDRDIYVANGHRSGKSCSDYCSRFWTHDIYTGDSKPSEMVDKLFGVTARPLRSGEQSWNGFEHNALQMNLGGKGFVDVGFLMGVAFEFDGRAVASDDFNGDGRPDLVVIENDILATGYPRQTLHVLGNLFAPASKTTRHWIGVRLRGAPGVSTLGAEITLKTATGEQPARVVAGDSLNCQHAPMALFGLGETAEAKEIVVRWPNGKQTRLERPAVDEYHDVSPK